ncbi:ABC transporter permease [Cellulomonas shaoxiangyii]|uniref:ABC transporter permease n=2 Tax=Cellulomonas shaoxiangyii TaxID=2566013 RepID=A0A4P7SNI6_9CELL|nr:ABC transporter permease [Cellulomonas shaoxiangyii]TGY84989.1 ABC transporter permease [Cellulomonas shaoxiangyii]
MTVDQPARPAAGAGGGAWSLTWHGVRTVAALELRQRVRSSRWKTALVVWVVAVGAITLLSSGALTALSSGDGGPSRGPLLFAIVSALVLGLGLLVTPTLTSTAVNGDRGAGTLATLQVTLLSAAEIALGKLLAAWAAALAFLVTSVPFLVIALALGDVPVAALPRVLAVVAVVLAAVCGIGLGWSTVAARPAGSTVLTFLTVAALAVFTPVFFGIAFASTSVTETVTVHGVSPAQWQELDEEELAAGTPDDLECTTYTEEREVVHTERIWWLLALNPFVVLADGAGTSPGEIDGDDLRVDPLGQIGAGVRSLRTGPPEVADECSGWFAGTAGLTSSDVPEPEPGAAVWPWGLGAHVLLGTLGLVVAVRRLQIPQRTLPRGTRVA